MFYNVWSENTALFERLMEIHSNSPKLYYGFKDISSLLHAIFRRIGGNTKVLKKTLLGNLCAVFESVGSLFVELNCYNLNLFFSSPQKYTSLVLQTCVLINFMLVVR